MPHSLRRRFTPARMAASLAAVGLLAPLMAMAPIPGLTGAASAVTGTITEYRPAGIVQTAASDPLGLTSAAGVLWYTDAGEDLTPPPGCPTPSTPVLPTCAPLNQVGQMNVDGSGFALHQIEPPGAVSAAITFDGTYLWVANLGSSTNDIDQVNLNGGLINSYGLADPKGVTAGTASAQPTSVAAGPDGRIWFTEFGAGRIGAITPVAPGAAPGTPALYTLPGGQNPGTTTTVSEHPIDITSGPGGQLWATVQTSQDIAMITTSGTISEDNVALPGLAGITTGADGNVWFTAEGAQAAGSLQADRPLMQGNGSLGMLPANAGPGTAATTFTPPGDASNFAPNAIVSGPDGNLYMTDVYGNAIWQFNPFTHAWAKFAVPTGSACSATSCNASAFSGNVQPTGIAVGPDDNIWFTENNANIPGANPQPAAISKVELDSFVGFDPTTVAFGTQALNTATTRNIAVGNSLGSAIAVTKTAITGDPTDFSITANGCSSSIPTGGCTITVQFKPTTSGTKSATLTLNDTQGSLSRTDSVGLGGAGAGAPSLTPPSFTFPDEAIGGVSRGAVFSLTNVSGSGIVINAGSVSLSGSNPSDFRILSDGCSGTTVANGSSCAVNVAFAPTTLGTRTATLVVNAPGGAQSATLSGRGIPAIAGSNPGNGYWLDATDGGIFSYGSATFHGSAGSIHLNAPIVGMARTPDGGGYWLVATDGGIFNYGDAGFFGSAGSIHLNKPIVGMAATPDGRGYWLVATDGGIFNYGDAKFFGSAGSIHLNQPIVGMAATPTGGGYWLVATDGGIFSYGDAGFHGSAGSIHLNKPIVGMAATPDGQGYWLVATDGGIFNYGDAGFHGSAGSIVLNKPIVGMAATLDGQGYWLVATDGGIFNYGDAKFFGSAGSIVLNKPIVGMAAAS
jgi:streptogramin lyase